MQPSDLFIDTTTWHWDEISQYNCMSPYWVIKSKLTMFAHKIESKYHQSQGRMRDCFFMANDFFYIKWQICHNERNRFGLWQFHTFMTNDTLSSFPFLWNWAKSDLVKEMCVSCSLAWQNLWHDKRQKFWYYFAISIVVLLMGFGIQNYKYLDLKTNRFKKIFVIFCDGMISKDGQLWHSKDNFEMILPLQFSRFNPC